VEKGCDDCGESFEGTLISVIEADLELGGWMLKKNLLFVDKIGHG
jgi:hypothetical protein